MADTVLLTGISGFVGGHVALALLRAGYHVRGSVRDIGKAEPVRQALARAGADTDRLEFVVLNLTADTGWREAAQGCRYLQHTASPVFVRTPKDPQVLIHPAVEGTRRAIAAALAAGVERIVLTSSIAAIQYGHPPDHPAFTESHWSRLEGPGVTPYARSKTLAEQTAWAMMEAAGRRTALATINPSVIFGSLLRADPGASGVLIQALLHGSVPLVPNLAFGIVDIRDVAALHLRAMESSQAGGRRWIASGGTLAFAELVHCLRQALPQFALALPRWGLPDWVFRFAGLVHRDLAAHAATLGVVRQFDTTASQALLGHAFIAPKDAALAMAYSLIDHKLV